jgi:hypothetical protein
MSRCAVAAIWPFYASAFGRGFNEPSIIALPRPVSLSFLKLRRAQVLDARRHH